MKSSVRDVSAAPARVPARAPRTAGSHDPGRLWPLSGKKASGSWKGRAPYLLLLPSVAAIALVLIWPAIQLGVFSAQDYGIRQETRTAPTTWVGLHNFATILADGEFWLALRNTVVFAVVVVALTLLTGTLVGLLLNRLGRKMAAFVSGAALLAWATPAVTATVIFYWLFDPQGGVADWLLSRLPHWLAGTGWAGFSWVNSALPVYTVLTVIVVWQGFPFIAVTVLAALKTVPAELLESARVDGAGPWKAFWRVTFPLLKPIFLLLLLLSVIWDFGVFTQTYLLVGGNRDEFNLSVYAWYKAFQFPPFVGLGAALALVLTVILLIITIGWVRANVREGAMS
jgi:ABC-type sugar transport system permease subunit